MAPLRTPNPAPTGVMHRLVQPTDTPADIVRRAEHLRQVGRPDLAAWCSREGIDAHPDDPLLLAAFGAALLDLCRPADAVAMFEKAAALAPTASAWFNVGNALLELGRHEEAITWLQGALERDPGLAIAHLRLGHAHQHARRYDDAAAAFRRALALRPDLAEARRGLGEIYLRLVPRWHFKMLNDSARAAAYDRAIRQLVRPGQLVLDIGGGTGLLAMMAARAGAAGVVSVEMVRPLAEVAREIVAANGFGEQIQVVAKRSLDLRIPGDLPRRADLLVAEIFDTGLLGEGALPTLRHARAELLAEGAQIIPRRAVIWATLIECALLAAEDRVGQVAGFDLSAFNVFSSPRYLQRRLADYPYRPLIEPVPVSKFDFRAKLPDSHERAIPVRVAETGVCHAVAFWFELELAPGIVLSSGPGGSAEEHWQQAVQIIQPVELAAAQTATLTVVQEDEHIGFTLEREPGR